MKPVTILIPTVNRITALAATLTSICFQTYTNFDVVISDQSDKEDSFKDPTIQAAIRILNYKGHSVNTLTNFPKKGIAQQRQFLLEKSHSQYSLFLDDDIILESYVIEGMVQAIEEEGCGLVGRAPIGLSYIHDVRRHEQNIFLWQGKVKPEIILPKTPKWDRHIAHNAANILHIGNNLEATPRNQKKYKIAWIGGCVLYDTEKLKTAGGFSFWKDLPPNHAGEDVLAQQRVMKKYGGCGIVPSGVYHQELPTTILKRDVNAPEHIGL